MGAKPVSNRHHVPRRRGSLWPALTPTSPKEHKQHLNQESKLKYLPLSTTFQEAHQRRALKSLEPNHRRGGEAVRVWGAVLLKTTEAETPTWEH